MSQLFHCFALSPLGGGDRQSSGVAADTALTLTWNVELLGPGSLSSHLLQRWDNLVWPLRKHNCVSKIFEEYSFLK